MMSSQVFSETGPFSVMFHHFTNHEHPAGQGAITEKQFENILDWLDKHFVLLNAEDFQNKALTSSLKSNEICLSFDDGLLCQFEVALPILEKRKVSAFFFIYSAPILGELNSLEIFRFFRTTTFDNIDAFYHHFFSQCETFLGVKFQKAQSDFIHSKHLEEFPFYTQNDRWFRYLRDVVLKEDSYTELMNKLMRKFNFNKEKIKNKLWMNVSNIKSLHESGHIIGLHSHRHPTTMHTLPIERQHEEYEINFRHLSEIIGAPIKTMAHPCGQYTPETLEILRNLGIKIGFRSNMNNPSSPSLLEIPREDHANILKRMIDS